MSNLRRLPVYLLLDTSESMAGPAIEAVQKGVDLLVNELKGNPLALETAFLSVITFSRTAKQVVPLTETFLFQTPKLSVRTGSSLGAALKLLLQCIQREVIRTTPTTKGDYKPLVFLLTDGQPTDDWQAGAKALRAANNPRIANIYAIGCGPDVDPEVLREITDIVLMFNDLAPDAFKRFFIWLSASVQSASLKLETSPGQPIDMPPLPASLEVAPTRTSKRNRSEKPRQVFLHARCQRTTEPYLMRFGLRSYDQKYEAIAAHPLDNLDQEDVDSMPPINASDLDGCPECPYCSNPFGGYCDCGMLFCSSGKERGPITCPGCKAQLHFGGGGNDFKVKRSSG